jgi:hypothetical protein
MMMRRFALVAAAALMLGCGGGEKIAPVSGTVKLDGKPLANAQVTFQPTGSASNPKAGVGSYGTTDANGNYSLKTSDTDNKSGAVVGTHRVAIQIKQGETDDRDPKLRPPPKVLPPKYNLNTELEFKVPPSGSSAANFDLSSK